MSGSYGVNPDDLKKTADGINATIGELKGLGIAESGEVGRGFSQISLRGMQVGHQGLERAFSDFCERWSWGVRTLVQDGSEIAARLHLSAGEYHDAEQYAIGTLKDAANAAVGDPHKSDGAVEQESWSEIGHDANPLNADYSAESWDKAGQDMSHTWRSEGRDLSEGPYGLGSPIERALGVGDQMDQQRDRIFGADTRQGSQ